jgi:hypothetical protein
MYLCTTQHLQLRDAITFLCITCQTFAPGLSTDGNSTSLSSGTGCKQPIADCINILYLTVETASFLYVIPIDGVPGCDTIMCRHVEVYGPVPTR